MDTTESALGCVGVILFIIVQIAIYVGVVVLTVAAIVWALRQAGVSV
jgi:hypothetical protein